MQVSKNDFTMNYSPKKCDIFKKIIFSIMILFFALPSIVFAGETKYLDFSETLSGGLPSEIEVLYGNNEQINSGRFFVISDNGNMILCGKNGGYTKKNQYYSSMFALIKDFEILNGEYSVKIKIVSGSGHAEGGLVFRFQDKPDYLLFKYCATHNRATLFRYTEGNRYRLFYFNLDKRKLDPLKWHKLKIENEGMTISGWIDDIKIFKINDAVNMEKGRAGLFTEKGTVCYFDDFTAIERSRDIKASEKKPEMSFAKWQIENVENPGDLGKFPSLCFDKQNIPCIAYYDEKHKIGKYAIKAINKWRIEIFDDNKGSGHFASLAFNKINEPNIAYCYSPKGLSPVENANGPHYAYYRNNVWNRVFGMDSGKRCFYSLALDKNDYPHIAYLDVDDFFVKHAYWTGKEWIIEAPVFLNPIVIEKGLRISLAINSSNMPCIAFYGLTRWSLNYMEKKDDSWIIETVERKNKDHELGSFSSMVLDKNDSPHISYYDLSNGCLKYATKKKNKWFNTVVDSSGNVGTYSSITLDKNDEPHIAYYDSSTGHINYCWQNKGKWNIIRTGCEGYSISLKLDLSGKPYIAYYDNNIKCLRFAHP